MERERKRQRENRENLGEKDTSNGERTERERMLERMKKELGENDRKNAQIKCV